MSDATIEDINKLSDPTIVGPGTWWVIHTKAKEATNDKRIDEFIDFMNFLRQHFSCPKCRKHIGEYIDTHPFDDLRSLTNEYDERIGMFKWAWMFHNAVNTRIGKKIYVEWETALDMFYNETEVCSSKCEETEHHTNNSNQSNNNEIGNNQNNIIPILPEIDRKSKLAQGYFMSIGIPNTLKKNGVVNFI